MAGSPHWGTHIVPLIKTLGLTSGPVLELGMGMSSTPLLHALCVDKDRLLVSYETEESFINMFKRYKNEGHQIHHVEEDKWADVDFSEHSWSVVLVDHHPQERRHIDAQRLVDADFVVLHDSQPNQNRSLHYDLVYPLFKYRADYTKDSAHTTILSNKHDIKL